MFMQKFILWFVVCLCAGTLHADEQIDTVTIDKLLKQSANLQRSNIDSCYLLALQSLVISEKLNYKRGVSMAYIRICSIMIIKGKYDSSIIYANKAIVASQAINAHARTSAAFLLLGYTYQGKGNSDSSLAMIMEAQRYGVLAHDTGNLINIYGTLGGFYTGYKEYDKALIHYLNAYRLAQKMGEQFAMSDALTGIGNCYYLKKKYTTALYYYIKADSLGRLMNEKTSTAQNLNNIALCYADLNKPNKALYYYQLALKDYRTFGMRSEEANLYYNMAYLYANQQKPDSVIFLANKALAMEKELRESGRIVQCYQLLAKAYAEKGNYVKAYHFQNQYALLNDSLLNTEKIRSISEMQTKYETELKTREIDVLQRENDIATLKASRSLGINFGLGGALLGIVFVAFAFYSQSKKREKLNVELMFEKQKSDDLLLNILPEEIATELKQNGEAIARQYNNVTVLFTDFVNFTGLSEQMSPTELVHEIHQNFTAFDAIIEKQGLEKIKTIGDAYLAVCGLPIETADHAQRIAKAALDIRDYMTQYSGKFKVRIGIHTGPVVAGIVGVKKYAYDIWGDTVNTASRMESTSEAGKINISSSTYELIKREFVCTYRGKINAKHKGEVDMYFVEQLLT